MCFCCLLANWLAGVLNVTKPCPGKCCTCWFVLSMLLTFVVFGIMVVFQIYLDKGDGEFPIESYYTFTGCLYAGNIVSFLGCMGCLIIVYLERKTIMLSTLCVASLLFGFCVALYCIYYLSFDTTTNRISEYSKEFYYNTKQAPALMDYIQANVRVEVPIFRHVEQLGCCGGKDFNDYAEAFLRTDLTTNETIFDAPDSCCKNITYGCGENLTYNVHYSELLFMEAAINLAKGDFDLTLDEYINEILKDWDWELNAVKERAKEEKNKTGDDRRKPHSIFKPVSNYSKYLYSPGENEASQKHFGDHDDLLYTVQKLHNKLKQFQLERQNGSSIVINVIGCGRIFDEFCSGCVIAFAVVKAFVELITVLVFACYYTRNIVHKIAERSSSLVENTIVVDQGASSYSVI